MKGAIAMAKIKAMGDTLMITTTLTRGTIEKVERYFPEALTIKDENENEIFKVGIGNASVSKYGICFPSQNPDGTLFMTTNNVVYGDHTDLNEEKAMIKDKYASVLNFLQIIEQNVDNCLDEIINIENSISGSIEVVDVNDQPEAENPRITPNILSTPRREATDDDF